MRALPVLAFLSVCFAQFLATSEQVYLATVRLELNLRGGDGKAASGVGTGFFFQHSQDPNKFWIVTNKHVLSPKGYKLLYIAGVFHQNISSFHSAALRETLKLRWTPPQEGAPGSPLFHQDPCVDIAAIPFEKPYGGPGWQKLGHPLKGLGEVRCFSAAHIFSNEALFESVVGVEQALMYGYPHSIYDAHHNLPNARAGRLSALAYIDYSPEFSHEVCNTTPASPMPLGVIDMACFRGSSGSPVVILDGENPHLKRDGVSHFGQPRSILLGVAFGTIFRRITREIKNIPIISEVEEDLHITFYWKASEILKLRAELVTANQHKQEQIVTIQKDVQ